MMVVNHIDTIYVTHSLQKDYRRANYFQGYKILRILKISLLIKIFVEKTSRLWTTCEIFTARSYVARGNKMCDRFEDASVIRTTARHHIYNIRKTLQSRKEPNNDCVR